MESLVYPFTHITLSSTLDRCFSIGYRPYKGRIYSSKEYFYFILQYENKTLNQYLHKNVKKKERDP